MASRLTISRTSLSDVQQRQVIIKLDGESFATLLYGRSLTREISPGSHRLRFDNTWAKKTVEFKAADGEEIDFSVINRAGRFTWWMVAVLGAGPMYLTIERSQSDSKPAQSSSGAPPNAP
jgi:hypothetical protein